MINLLPPDIKQGYGYAHRNEQLLHWVVGFGCGIVGICLITAAGLIIMNRSINGYHQQITSTQAQLAAQKYPEVVKNVTSISNNFKLVVKVLSQEVLFSKLLTRLGNVMPKDAVLTGLAIDQVQGGINITAQTTNDYAATQVQINLADPHNNIFSKADIESITCNQGTSDPGTLKAAYPCTVSIRALFVTDSPYLFISNATAEAKS